MAFRNTLTSRFLILTLIISLCGCGNNKDTGNEDNTAANKNLIRFSVVTTYPHDVHAFTEGLLIHDGKIYESTGSDESYVAQIDLSNGNAVQKVGLGRQYFGEGIAILNNKIYELTWKNKVGFIYDLRTLKRIGQFTYNFEGWGMTEDGAHLIASDGTEKLYYLDTTNFKVVKTLHINDSHAPATHINELEYVNGIIYANQWETDYLLKIDPEKQEVVGRFNLSPLHYQARILNPDIDVLNGVAYDEKTGNLLVTGKYWPLLFAIRPE